MRIVERATSVRPACELWSSSPILTRTASTMRLHRRPPLRSSKAGHQVTVLDLYGEGFRAAMSNGEWLAYHSDRPILDPMVERHAEIVKQAEALVFVYPTWWSTMPAILKGWLERVMVPGVGFVFDETATRAARPHASAAHRRHLDIRLAEAVREGDARQRSAHLAARTEAQHGDPDSPIVARACTRSTTAPLRSVPRSCGASSERCSRCERLRRLLPS